METVRKEILPGVWLTALENDKFKTGCLSISLLTQLDRETAAMNALIPYGSAPRQQKSHRYAGSRDRA